MSDEWVDRCMNIPLTKVSDLSDDMVKYYAYLYLKISNAVDSMGGMANFSHWMNNHAKNYFNTCNLQQEEIEKLKTLIVEARQIHFNGLEDGSLWVKINANNPMVKKWLGETTDIKVDS